MKRSGLYLAQNRSEHAVLAAISIRTDITAVLNAAPRPSATSLERTGKKELSQLDGFIEALNDPPGLRQAER
jgi:hypothetical protein